MDDMMRMQVYLEMSKDAVKDYCASQAARRGQYTKEEEVLEAWNHLFARTCKRLGVKP